MEKMTEDEEREWTEIIEKIFLGDSTRDVREALPWDRMPFRQMFLWRARELERVAKSAADDQKKWMAIKELFKNVELFATVGRTAP